MAKFGSPAAQKPLNRFWWHSFGVYNYVAGMSILANSSGAATISKRTRDFHIFESICRNLRRLFYFASTLASIHCHRSSQCHQAILLKECYERWRKRTHTYMASIPLYSYSLSYSKLNYFCNLPAAVYPGIPCWYYHILRSHAPNSNGGPMSIHHQQILIPSLCVINLSMPLRTLWRVHQNVDDCERK